MNELILLPGSLIYLVVSMILYEDGSRLELDPALELYKYTVFTTKDFKVTPGKFIIPETIYAEVIKIARYHDTSYQYHAFKTPQKYKDQSPLLLVRGFIYSPIDCSETKWS